MPLSRTEFIARSLLQHYLPKDHFQYSVRPDWLRNPKTGRRLELDIYCPARGFAIEVDGIQHGRFVAGMQRDFDHFTDQQSRDMHKIETCKQHGITLYKLTIFDLTQQRFAPFLVRLCVAHRMQLDRYVDAPKALFAEAERLSRSRVVRRKYRRPGLLPLLKRLFA
jgi:hypothetical protein